MRVQVHPDQPDWIIYFPMARGAVKAMDAVSGRGGGGGCETQTSRDAISSLHAGDGASVC
jgi:hypothetical protein